MSRPPIGEVLVSLDLLSQEQVEELLAVLRNRQRGRFGELALELGYIDEAGLARGLAAQFDLGTLAPERIARLSVSLEALESLPVAFMREHLVVPTWTDPETRSLSLLVADPTAVVVLREAQQHARARQLRLFVGARSAISQLLDRSLSASAQGRREEPLAEDARFRPGSGEGPGTVVLETDPARLAALKRLDALEGGGTEYVSDPDQVTALLEAGACNRVVLRRALSGDLEAWRGVWRRGRPGLTIRRVGGFGPGRLHELGDPLYDSLLALVRWEVRRDRSPEEARRVLATSERAAGLARELRLGADQERGLALCALLAHAPALLDALAPTLPVDARLLLDRLHRRNSQDAPTRELSVELLHASLLPEDAAGDLDPEVRAALERLRERKDLLEGLAEGRRPLSGTLTAGLLPQLLRALRQGGGSGVLEVSGGASPGLLAFRGGRAVFARHGDREGLEALHGLACLASGRFEVRAGALDEADNLAEDTDALLDQLDADA